MYKEWFACTYCIIRLTAILLTLLLKVVTIKFSMKTIIRSILFYSFSLYIASGLFPAGLKITGGIQTLFTGGVILSLMSFILRPIVHIIAFPISILTLGLFSFIVNVFLLFLMTRFVTHISIHAFIIEKVSLQHIS